MTRKRITLCITPVSFCITLGRIASSRVRARPLLTEGEGESDALMRGASVFALADASQKQMRRFEAMHPMTDAGRSVAA